jgi:hypothetical protein
MYIQSPLGEVVVNTAPMNLVKNDLRNVMYATTHGQTTSMVSGKVVVDIDVGHKDRI